MCDHCSRDMPAATDSNLCQNCQDQRDLKDIEGNLASTNKDLQCLIVQMANLDILRAQYERSDPYSELAEETKAQVLAMKKSEHMSRRNLNDLTEKKWKIEHPTNDEKETTSAHSYLSASVPEVPASTSALPPISKSPKKPDNRRRNRPPANI